jgi:GntR family transcriptional regulator/MocR family aminotransferase
MLGATLRWDLLLEIADGDRAPLALRLARSLAEQIREGRLAPGTRLPGTRSLARRLAISRNTAEAAYRELQAQGWIESLGPSGSYVSRELPQVRPRPAAAPRRMAQTPGFALPKEAGLKMAGADLRADLPPGTIRWDFGVPDPRLAPSAELGRELRRCLQRQPGRVLSYSRYLRDHWTPLETALTTMLSATRGLAVEPSNLLVTRGSQMALYLIARTLFRPGDRVAVEEPGYVGMWDTIRASGARIVPIPVDEEGLMVDHLARVVRRQRVRAVMVTPHHHFPTTVTLSAGRRMELLGLARSHGLAIVEDDYDHEFHYSGRPVLPLAGADRSGLVLYVGSLSKVVAPGLRVGYLAGPKAFIERARRMRASIDIEGGALMDAAVANLMEDGELQRHLRRAQRVYRQRRDHLARLLRSQLSEVLDFSLPSGGMAIWARVARTVDVEAWLARAIEHRLTFRTGSVFYLDGKPVPFVRLGFCRLDEGEQEDAVGRMVSAL